MYKNKEDEKRWKREYRIKNKDLIKVAQQLWYQKNKEHKKKYNKKWKEEHREKQREYSKKWNKKRKNKDWKILNKDKISIYKKRDKKNNWKKYKIRGETYRIYGKVPNGYERHHFNYDSPHNFILMQSKEHKELHNKIKSSNTQ